MLKRKSHLKSSPFSETSEGFRSCRNILGFWLTHCKPVNQPSYCQILFVLKFHRILGSFCFIRALQIGRNRRSEVKEALRGDGESGEHRLAQTPEFNTDRAAGQARGSCSCLFLGEGVLATAALPAPRKEWTPLAAGWIRFVKRAHVLKAEILTLLATPPTGRRLSVSSRFSDFRNCVGKGLPAPTFVCCYSITGVWEMLFPLIRGDKEKAFSKGLIQMLNFITVFFKARLPSYFLFDPHGNPEAVCKQPSRCR